MNIFVYADESGVFDKKHEKYYVFGGLIFLDKENRDILDNLTETVPEKEVEHVAEIEESFF